VSYFNNGSGAEVLEENNYYPFGLKHEGYNALAGNPSYQYKYNEKELQQETGWSDYGWRQYIPEIGKWNGMDQLAEKYYSTSPFAYVANNPISSFDFDGRMFNDDGTIDTSGTANGFVRNRSFMSQDFGQRPGEGGGITIGELLDAAQGKSNPGDVDFSQFDFTKYGADGGPGGPIVQILIWPSSRDNGHTAIKIDGTVYGYYPTDINGDGHYRKEDIYDSPGQMHIDNERQFRANYDGDSIVSFNIKISPSKAKNLENYLKNVAKSPGNILY